MFTSVIANVYTFTQEAKRQASLEHYNRMGMLEELRIDKVVEENKKLERDLNKIMKGLNKTSNGSNGSEQRFVSRRCNLSYKIRTYKILLLKLRPYLRL